MVTDYWKKRIAAEQLAKMERSATISDVIGRLYDYHFKELEKEIRAFEQRYADKNGLSLSEVKARVDDMDVRAFEEKAKKYVAEKDFSAKANSELELYNLKMKVNRLELLQYQLDLEMVALGDAEHKLTERFLSDEYVKAIATQSGLLGQSVISAEQVRQAAETVLNTSFKGARWSERIWQRQDALREIVARMTEDYLLKGKNPTTMIAKIRKEFEVSASDAKRLAVTEGARVATEAQRQSLVANDYEEYEYIAEPKACDICKALDGKIFKVKDMEPGKNAAPMHPHCHCSVAAHFSMSDGEYDRVIKESGRSVRRDDATKEEIFKTSTPDGIDKFFKEQKSYQKWYNGLEEDKKQAIYEYTTEDYEYINFTNRLGYQKALNERQKMWIADGNRKEDLPFALDIIHNAKKQSDAILEAISSFEVDKPFTMYRGVKSVSDDGNDLGYLNLKTGQTFVLDKSFASFSLDYKVASNFSKNNDYKISGNFERIIFETTVQKGQKIGAYINELSEIDDEYEFLTKPNLEYKVLSKRRDTNLNATFFEIEVIEDGI